MTPQQIVFFFVLALVIIACVTCALSMPSGKPRKAKRPRSTAAPVRGDLLRPKEVSKLLGIPLSTLANMRSAGRGPAFIQDGKPVYYRRSDVETWLVMRRQAATLQGGTEDHARLAGAQTPVIIHTNGLPFTPALDGDQSEFAR